MKKVVILISVSISVLFAEMNMKTMMDKIELPEMIDINISSLRDKVKIPDILDINVSSVINKVKDISFTWQENLKEAFDLAKDTDKTIMVMVEGKNCRWCKKMLKRTIGDEGVKNKLSDYISVKVNRNDMKTMKNLPEVTGVPTVFFMDKEHNIIETVVGYFDVMDFKSYIGDVEKKLEIKK